MTLFVRATVAISIVALVVGAGIGTGFVIGSITLLPTGHCAPSMAIANLTIRTPALIVNSPYLGQASGDYTWWANTSSQTIRFTSGVGSSNGSVGYSLNLTNWTVWSTHSVGSGGPSCAGAFLLTEVPTAYSIVFDSSNYTNDSASAQSFGGGTPPWPGGSPENYVYFNDSFSQTTGTIQTCDRSAVIAHDNSGHIDLEIPFQYQGVQHTANLAYRSVMNFTYTFPSDGGSWAIDNLSASGGPGGGWAFSYLGPCP